MVSLDLAASLVGLVLDFTGLGVRSPCVGWTEASAPSAASISLSPIASCSCSPVKFNYI